jgi:hypothetical protein
MAIKISLFITLALYAVIVSQSLFYILALSDTMRKMQLSTYIESRKLIDQNLRKTLTSVYYLALASSLLLTAFAATNPSGVLFISSLVAFFLLLLDAMLSLKGNVPINDLINSWTENDHPTDWQKYRARWFCIYQVRQVANIAGFIALLTGLFSCL